MKELRPGDVVIFKAGDDWIGKSIAWLTDSDVSHAAIMLENMTMAEMGASGIHVGKVQAQQGSGAMVLRLSPEKDSAPLVAAAQKYVDRQTRYDFPVLALLAGLIIYRKIRPTPKMVEITDVLVRAACSALDRLIQIALKDPSQAMVCSQLVYQVYNDCGKEYRIKINGGQLQDCAAAGADNAAPTDDGFICLAELVSSAQADCAEPVMATAASRTEVDEQKLAEELFCALQQQGETADSDLCADNLGALPAWCARFLDRLEEFLEATKSELPIDALFITPADIAYHADNLSLIEEIALNRV